MTGELLEADQLELHPADQVDRVVVEIRVFLERQTDIFEQRHRAEQRARLVHDADLAQYLVERRVVRRHDVVTVDHDTSRLRRIEADHVLQQRALAASRAAENDEDLAASHLEAHVVEQDEIAVAGGQAFDMNNRVRRSGQRWTPTLAAALNNSAASLPPEGEQFAARGGPSPLMAHRSWGRHLG